MLRLLRPRAWRETIGCYKRQPLLVLHLTDDVVGSYQYERSGARCLMDLPRVFATKHVFRGVQPLQLFQVEVVLTTVPMYAVSERTQAFAQVFGKLMHRWACLGAGRRLNMVLGACGSKGR
jgi:hypothetical protein